MSARIRTIVAVAVTLGLLGGAGAYCAWAVGDYQSRQRPVGESRTAAVGGAEAAGRVVFRNTDTTDGYGLVASVALADPRGERAISSTACDRVYASAAESICLRIDRGVLTTFSATLLAADGTTERTWPLPGLPSRARLSPDGSLVAFTSFVSGESYGSIDFSTATQISTVTGTDYGNLEDFALFVDGQRNTAADRNFWGVTFTADDSVFYATAATGGQNWLVRGDLAARTLTTVKRTVECPSVSPDGTRIAYKKNVSTTATAHWSVAVLDLATGKETLMPDPRTIDDQVEWLDDGALLYGVPRDDAVGDSDVWRTAADGSGAASVFIEHAASPAVVRR